MGGQQEEQEEKTADARPNRIRLQCARRNRAARLIGQLVSAKYFNGRLPENRPGLTGSTALETRRHFAPPDKRFSAHVVRQESRGRHEATEKRRRA